MASSGRYVNVNVAGEGYRAFLPNPLPPVPPIRLTDADYDLMEKANRALGRLDGATLLLPNPSLFIYFYIRKEAVLSSQIEGTQSSLSDLLMHEASESLAVPLDDVVEVSNYVAAMDHGLAKLQRKELPISLRLIREIHSVLLADGRGSEKQPGEFRSSQNWISGSRPGNALYVPPPADAVVECMGDLELFLHDQPRRTPALLKAALAHVQFETIHPFLDGNGRMGRLLITLLLCAEEVLEEPLLYLSLYFKQNRDAYYEHLQRVRTHGEWLPWIRFFLEGVRETAQQSVQTARRILELFASDDGKIEGRGRRSGMAHRAHDLLMQHPFASASALAEALGISRPTAYSTIALLEEIGILRETTGRKRKRAYVYDAYLRILQEGTEPQRRGA